MDMSVFYSSLQRMAQLYDNLCAEAFIQYITGFYQFFVDVHQGCNLKIANFFTKYAISYFR